jgi:uncharacterized protein (DUF433 family)
MDVRFRNWSCNHTVDDLILAGPSAFRSSHRRILADHQRLVQSDDMTKVVHPHITTDACICGGSPCLEGTRIPVWTVVVYVLHHGITPEELLAYCPHVGLAAIYDALSYYYDHRADIDVEIAAHEALEPPGSSQS